VKEAGGKESYRRTTDFCSDCCCYGNQLE